MVVVAVVEVVAVVVVVVVVVVEVETAIVATSHQLRHIAVIYIK